MITINNTIITNFYISAIDIDNNILIENELYKNKYSYHIPNKLLLLEYGFNFDDKNILLEFDVSKFISKIYEKIKNLLSKFVSGVAKFLKYIWNNYKKLISVAAALGLGISFILVMGTDVLRQASKMNTINELYKSLSIDRDLEKVTADKRIISSKKDKMTVLGETASTGRRIEHEINEEILNMKKQNTIANSITKHISIVINLFIDSIMAIINRIFAAIKNRKVDDNKEKIKIEDIIKKYEPKYDVKERENKILSHLNNTFKREASNVPIYRNDREPLERLYNVVNNIALNILNKREELYSSAKLKSPIKSTREVKRGIELLDQLYNDKKIRDEWEAAKKLREVSGTTSDIPDYTTYKSQKIAWHTMLEMNNKERKKIDIRNKSK